VIIGIAKILRKIFAFNEYIPVRCTPTRRSQIPRRCMLVSEENAMVTRLLSADADTFEITAAEIGFTLAMEEAIAERYPWLLVPADDGGWRISAGDLETIYGGQLWGHA